MTASTVERNTPARAAADFSLPVAAAEKILAGTIVVLNAAGYAEAGATATAKKTVGVAQATVDNTGGSAGDVSVPVARGCFRFANSASTEEITLADYGANCYVVDNQTVGKTAATATRSVAGVVRGVDSTGVWVEF